MARVEVHRYVHVPCAFLCLSFQVSLGWGHAVARTAAGRVLAWGFAAHGRLGLTPESPASEAAQGQEGEEASGSGQTQCKVPGGKEGQGEESAEEGGVSGTPGEGDCVVWEPTFVSDLLTPSPWLRSASVASAPGISTGAPGPGARVLEVACGSDHTLFLTGKHALKSASHVGSQSTSQLANTASTLWL